MRLVMKNRQVFGKAYEFQRAESPTFQNQRIGGQRVILVLVVLTRRYFTGSEKVNFRLLVQTLQMMKITGWKSGIMSLWNTTNFQMEAL